MSHKYVDNQYADGFTPETVCRCRAFRSLSSTMNVANDLVQAKEEDEDDDDKNELQNSVNVNTSIMVTYPAMNGNDSTSRNHSVNVLDANVY